MNLNCSTFSDVMKVGAKRCLHTGFGLWVETSVFGIPETEALSVNVRTQCDVPVFFDDGYLLNVITRLAREGIDFDKGKAERIAKQLGLESEYPHVFAKAAGDGDEYIAKYLALVRVLVGSFYLNASISYLIDTGGIVHGDLPRLEYVSDRTFIFSLPGYKEAVFRLDGYDWRTDEVVSNFIHSNLSKEDVEAVKQVANAKIDISDFSFRVNNGPGIIGSIAQIGIILMRAYINSSHVNTLTKGVKDEDS